ncbi:MAG TPA: ribosome small subunit-dependent GTPase A [Acidimicrobiales bacterium]|nr:ribosome small subunit-dependent GTPase A [Acidimicrobiales bacterium]
MEQAQLADLGWDAAREAEWGALGAPPRPGRVVRLDRGWSTVAVGRESVRVRNLGTEVAVGDWVVAGDERVEAVLERRSAFTRRASFAGAKAEPHVLAANIDTVLLLHALTATVNPRRLERELVLAFDSGAQPVVVLTKADLVAEPAANASALRTVTSTVPILVVSAVSGQGLDAVRVLSDGHRTVALLGASGVGKSTLVNALVGREVQATAEVTATQRGRHTTVAAELIALPGGGWLLDTPGLRAVSLWWEGNGIEQAFADIFELMDHCRFRDCKHEGEPGCAVRAAVAAGTLDPDRLDSFRRLVDEQVAIEEEQRARDRAADRRGSRRPR